jgi:hypothetical protein
MMNDPPFLGKRGVARDERDPLPGGIDRALAMW